MIAPVIPGSSIRGALRARAEFIGKSLGLKNGLDTIIENLFGSRERAGCLRFCDVFVSQPEGKDTTSIASASVAEWIAENETVLDSLTERNDHVAICRFTGGASGSALFNDRTPKRGLKWEPIEIEMDMWRAEMSAREVANKETADHVSCCQALLLLILKDLRDGMIPIGYGTRKGLGDVRVTETKEPKSLDKEKIKQEWEKLLKSCDTRSCVAGKGEPANDC